MVCNRNGDNDLGDQSSFLQVGAGQERWERPAPRGGWDRRGAGRPGQHVDTLDCAVWNGRVKRSVPSWSPGDVVEVSGSIRRRFYAAGAAKLSRYQVEVTGGRLIRRAASG